MEENNDLDSLIATPETVNNAPSVAPHHKLKKIKRPKIRPSSDIPPAPQKVSVGSTEEDIVSKQPSAEISSQDFTQTDLETSQTTGTNLVTATDAKSIAQESEQANSSYILDALPPDLDYMDADDARVVYQQQSPIKKLVLISLMSLVIGVFTGALLFSTKTEEKHGLEDVILNPDVPQGRARCGLTEKSQACIFYVMNCYKQELTGRDFYKLAATLTGREEYMIETENLRYATVKIKPGAFAQLNIPALK